MITIQNEEIRVVVSTAGAEVQNITDVKTGREYLWQGDAKYWNGRSPLLFPNVGGLWNGRCRIEGKELALPKHGFVRCRNWRAVEVEAESVRMEYVSTVGDFAAYPFAFCVAVTYRLEGRTLVADLEVRNLGGASLWFQFGGHPAIAMPGWKEENEVDGYLRFEGNVTHLLRAGEQGCLEPDSVPVPVNAEGLVPLCVETFAHEALITEANELQAVTVLDLGKQPVARVTSSSPAWLFWSPQGVHAPFVCAEPWYGLPDRQGFEGPVEERPYIQKAEGGQTWTGRYAVEVF